MRKYWSQQNIQLQAFHWFLWLSLPEYFNKLMSFFKQPCTGQVCNTSKDSYTNETSKFETLFAWMCNTSYKLCTFLSPNRRAGRDRNTVVIPAILQNNWMTAKHLIDERDFGKFTMNEWTPSLYIWAYHREYKYIAPICTSQIARIIGPARGPPGSCRPQVGPILAPWTLLSGMSWLCFILL